MLLCDPGAARVLGEHAPGAPVQVLLTVDLGDRREGVLPDVAPAVAAELAGLPGIELAGISVNFACLSGQLPLAGAVPAGRGRARGRSPASAPTSRVLSLGGTCVVQHLDGYAPRFATEIRSGGGPMYGYDFVSGCGIAGLERTDPVLTAAVLECYRKPPAPEGPGGLDAFGHVPEVDLPDEDAWYAHAGPRAARHGARRAAAARSPAPTSPGRPATSASSSRPSRCAPATRSASPSTTTRSCAP